MQVVSVSDSNDIEEIMFDLEAETYILELLMKCSHFIETKDDVKQRALDNITDYQRQHLTDLFRFYKVDKLIVPTANRISKLHSILEHMG